MSRRAYIAGCLITAWSASVGAAGAPTHLEWRGTAKVYAGERTIELGLHTTVEPFRRARSESWRLADGPAKMIVLSIESTSGTVVRQGKPTAMTFEAATHERQQYGLYGYMARALRRAKRSGDLQLEEPGYPPIVFHFDHGRPTSADYTVSAPEGGSKIVQRITFDGQVESNGVRWPRRLSIAQEGRRYFELTLTDFTAR